MVILVVYRFQGGAQSFCNISLHTRLVIDLLRAPVDSRGGLCDSSSIRGGFWLVEGAVRQHGEQHVAASSGKSDERLIVALACWTLRA